MITPESVCGSLHMHLLREELIVLVAHILPPWHIRSKDPLASSGLRNIPRIAERNVEELHLKLLQGNT